MVAWNSNWRIITIDGQWPWCHRLGDFSPHASATPNLCRGLSLGMSTMYAIRYFFGVSRDSCICLSWNGCSFLSPWVRRRWWLLETTVQYLVIHGELHQDILLILSLIKYAFEYLFSACWLFVIANISPPSLHPLLKVDIVKPPGADSFD